MNTTPIVDFNDLDLSVLDELGELQARRTLLVGRLAQMDERRSDVAPAVYLRVRADYEQQRKKLESEEQPLKQNARSIYARVRDRFDVLEREEGDARLNLQELEFRHSLGEFDKSQFNVRKAEIDAGINGRAAEFGHAKQIRERFIAIFGSEAELSEPQSPQADAVSETILVAPVSVPAPQQAAPSMHSTIQQAPVSPQFPGMPPLPAPGIPGMPPIPNAQTSKPQIEQMVDPPKAEPRRPANPDATVVFRPGRLTPMNPEAGIAPTMLSLKPINIGSDSAGDVRISAPGVQPKHVEICLTRAGFILKDVGGGGLVLIDGQTITEQLLRDGDAVQIGPARFSFKLA
jgi:hypothetical protein